MYGLRKLIQCGLMVSLAAISSAVYAQTRTSAVAPSAQPSQAPSNVVVVNSSNQPVPVSVIGTPTVKIDSTTPVSIRDAGASVPMSFHGAFDNEVTSSVFTSFTVPPAKILVVEYVSARTVGGLATEHVRASISLYGANGELLQKHFLAPSSITPGDFIFSAPVKMYVGAGDTMLVGVERSAVGAAWSVEYTASARLIDP